MAITINAEFFYHKTTMLPKQRFDVFIKSLLHVTMIKLVLLVYLDYIWKIVFSITTKRDFSQVFFGRLMGPFRELLKYEDCTRYHIM